MILCSPGILNRQRRYDRKRVAATRCDGHNVGLNAGAARGVARGNSQDIGRRQLHRQRIQESELAPGQEKPWQME